MITLGERLDKLIENSHYAAINGEHNAENELNEIDDLIRAGEKKVQ